MASGWPDNPPAPSFTGNNNTVNYLVVNQPPSHPYPPQAPFWPFPQYSPNLQQQEAHRQLLSAPQYHGYYGEPGPYHLLQPYYAAPAAPYPAYHTPLGIQPAAHHVTPAPAALKRKRSEEADTDIPTETAASRATPHGPSSDGYSKKRADTDSEVLRLLTQELEHVLQDEQLAPNSHHHHSASFMLQVARVAQVADQDNSAIRFVQSATAARLLNSGNKLAGPLVVTDVSLDTIPYSNLAKLLDDQELHGIHKLDVQDSERRHTDATAATMDMHTVRSTFEEKADTDYHPPRYPANALSCIPTHPQGIMPYFTNGPEVGFLGRIHARINGSGAKDANALKVKKKTSPFSTFAQAGALTLPHIDANGFGTVLTCAKGSLVIFVLDSPSDATMESFVSAPRELPTGGKWRVVVLREGESFVMGGGTVHAVARTRNDCKAQYSWTLGGHFLQKSQISECARICQLQIQHNEIINEDATLEALPYLVYIAKQVLIETDSKPGWEMEFGGQETVTEFWRLLEQIDRNLVPKKIKNLSAFRFRLEGDRPPPPPRPQSSRAAKRG